MSLLPLGVEVCSVVCSSMQCKSGSEAAHLGGPPRPGGETAPLLLSNAAVRRWSTERRRRKRERGRRGETLLHFPLP